MHLKEESSLEVRKQKSNPLTSSPNLKRQIQFLITCGDDRMSAVFLGGIKTCSLGVILHYLSHMIQGFALPDADGHRPFMSRDSA